MERAFEAVVEPRPKSERRAVLEPMAETVEVPTDRRPESLEVAVVDVALIEGASR